MIDGMTYEKELEALEPRFRPKVHKIQIKQYGLRKFVRVEKKGKHAKNKNLRHPALHKA